MLDAEEASTRLEAIRVADWREQIDERAGKLTHRRYRQTVALVMEPDARDATRRAEQQAGLVEGAGALDGFDLGQLVDFMEILHPAMAATLARWWADAKHQPYPQGWGRRAFRAPRHPEVSRAARIGDLRRIVSCIGPYDRDAVWLAGWATYLQQRARTDPAVGPLLAAAIDAGGKSSGEVFDTLIQIGSGEHPIGVMGRHVIVGLLRAGRPDGWEFVERLLLAAQRQEGLRQVILESADEGRPEAFDRLLGVVVEHKLTRFAATVRAVGVWLGLPGDVTDIPKIAERVAQVRRFRTDLTARGEALGAGDAWAAHVALCSTAMTDVHTALEAVPAVLGRADRDVRAGAVRFLRAAGLRSANAYLAAALADADLAVAVLAAGGIEPGLAPPDAFERLRALAERLPAKPRAVEGVGVEAAPVTLSRAEIVTRMLANVGSRPLSVLLPWLGDMDTMCRYRFVTTLGKQSVKLTAELRDTIIALVGDRSSTVRRAAVAAAGRLEVTGEDVESLEGLLTRSASDLRRAVIGMLAKQGPTAAVASAERLWAGGAAQRNGAVELLASLGPDDPSVRDAARRMVAEGVTDHQRELLATVTGKARSIDPGLGLYDPARRTPTCCPAPAKRSFACEEARRIVSALDDLAAAHRDEQFVLVNWQGSRELLLADAQWLPSPFARNFRPPSADDEEGSGLVLAETFRGWWATRHADLRAGPLDALYAYAAAATAINRAAPGWQNANAEANRWWFDLQSNQVGGSVGILRHRIVVQHVLSWLLLDEATRATITACLDAYEDALAAVPRRLVDQTPPATRQTGVVMTMDEVRRMNQDWRLLFSRLSWLNVLSGLFSRRPELFDSESLRRWFNLSRLVDEPVPGAKRRPVPQGLLLAAHEAGVANDDDVYDAMFETRLLDDFTRRRRDSVELRHPGVVQLADRLRDRVVEVERARGDLATPASRLAHRVASVSGAGLALELLARLGRAVLLRGFVGGNEGREAVYSHLLRISYPGPTDTGTVVAELASKLKVRDTGLVDLALYAPQWAALIEDALGWGGLADAVWWFHAHSKDEQWAVSIELREAWTAQTAERTGLSAADRLAGAVDVEWFKRCRETLGPQRWKVVHAAAKLASGGNGHRRAQLFAEAMLEEIDEGDLVARITAKRHQDSVRALGLLPLPAGQPDADAAVARRYAVMREFERGSAKFGSQRQASERTAVRIGVENLARSAGYADPQRFVWATEAAESGDLAAGPVTVTKDDVTATLAVDDEGIATFTVARNGKSLAAVPAALRKAPDIGGLRERKTALGRQAVRVRSSLEEAMVRQERFSRSDLDALAAHPIVAPMLRRLVFTDESGATMRPTPAGWVASSGEIVAPSGAVRLSHPVDLIGSGDWINWQERLFVDERRQPFKQVFRELYVLTEAERATSPLSRRYEGHQVQPRQALALFGRRGWIHDREAGDVSKVFHDHDLVARIAFLDGFGTPAEVELPTVGAIGFTRRNSFTAEPVEAVPPVVFSETMRDLDLVVSVAHAGGVDPEASASTVEMRAALVRETTRLLKLGNVREVGSHVVIEGTLGEYSVHLGSAVVHRRPGGAVCIIPVNSQRRGRLFLPFADDDPKTAEVLSKVLLLANDRQIKDPTILEQLRS